MKNFLKIFGSYIKRHFVLLIAFGLIVAIFSAIFSLYDLPVEAVAYASVLTVIALAVLGFIRFFSFYKKHKILCHMKNVIDVSLDGLPVTGSLIEKDYQQLIEILNDSKISAKSSADMQMQDMLDYYVMWAHQIKTPIAAMCLLLQTDENAANEELSEQLFRIEQYVEMVLHYLRTQSMCSDLVLKKYPLDDIVKQAVRKYRKQFIRKKITLDLSHLDCMVLTDEKWLGFVIEQILSNSLKYTGKGSVSIYMDDFLPKTLVIEDSGIGISAEDLPRIFEKGFTGYNGRENKKSTGIGLYLCKRILEKLSHTITVTSVIDKGTIVKIGLDSVDMVME